MSSDLEYLSQGEKDALKAAVFQRLHPRTYLERYVEEGVRTDGRAFGQFRDVYVNVGSISTADGSALVRMGKTVVVCGVKAEIAEPELDRPDEGFLVPNVDLPALCSPRYKPGAPSDEAQVLSERVNEALGASGFLPLDALVIRRGKAVWTLFVDATCVCCDGAVFDASLVAVVAALRNTTLPKAVYDPDTNGTVCYRGAPRVPLGLSSRVPLSVSFGIFDSKVIFADPTAFEEPLLDTTLSIVLDDKKQIVSVSQLGSGLLVAEEEEEEKHRDALKECISLAQSRIGELQSTLPR